MTTTRYRTGAKLVVSGDSWGGVSGKLPPVPDGEVVTVCDDFGQSHVNVFRANGQLRTIRRTALAEVP